MARAPQRLDRYAVQADRSADNREDQHDALGDGGEISRYVERQQEVDHQHERVGADDGPDCGAPSAAEQGSAENDGREALQKQRIADERIGGAGLRADENAGHAIEQATENEGAEPRPLD